MPNFIDAPNCLLSHDHAENDHHFSGSRWRGSLTKEIVAPETGTRKRLLTAAVVSNADPARSGLRAGLRNLR
jgi:hypothetical protein